MSAKSDAELVRASLAGDSDAFGGLYDRYARSVYSVCRSIVVDPQLAADAAHDTFMACGRRLRLLRDPAGLRPWLLAIAVDFATQQSRRRPPQPHEPVVVRLDPGDRPDRVSTEIVGEIYAAIEDSLDVGERLILRLAYREELAEPDLAQALGVRVDHVSAHLRRAQRRLDTVMGWVVIARMGRADCAVLDRVLDGWDGRLSMVWQDRVTRHIDGCWDCMGLRSLLMTPTVLGSVIPEPLPPTWLRASLEILVPDVLGVERVKVTSARSASAGNARRPRGLSRPLVVAGGVAVAAVVGVATAVAVATSSMSPETVTDLSSVAVTAPFTPPAPGATAGSR